MGRPPGLPVRAVMRRSCPSEPSERMGAQSSQA